MKAERSWMPTTVTPLIHRMAWVMLVAQSVIIVSGALVRLTGSGLGCPTWPKCTADSWTNTVPMGIHGFIEFGNRMLGVVLGLICIAMFLMVWRLRKSRPDIFWSVFALALVVPVQAVIGGVSVHLELNPWIVAAHFVPSAICVSLATWLLRRTSDAGGKSTRIGTPAVRFLAWAIYVLTALVVVLGVMTTGAGPHAGDAASARNGFNTLTIARMHAFPVWLMVISTIVLVVLAGRQKLPEVRRAAIVLLVVEALQGVIGYVQFFTGLPVWLVACHMVGLCLVIAASTAVLDSVFVRAPLPGRATAQSPAEAAPAS